MNTNLLLTRKRLLGLVGMLCTSLLSLPVFGRTSGKAKQPLRSLEPQNRKPEVGVQLIATGENCGVCLCDQDGRVLSNTLSVKVGAHAGSDDLLIADVRLYLKAIDIKGEAHGRKYRIMGSGRGPANPVCVVDLHVQDDSGRPVEDVVAFSFQASVFTEDSIPDCGALHVEHWHDDNLFER